MNICGRLCCNSNKQKYNTAPVLNKFKITDRNRHVNSKYKIKQYHNRDIVQKENTIGFRSSSKVIQGYLSFLSTLLSLMLIISKNTFKVSQGNSQVSYCSNITTEQCEDQEAKCSPDSYLRLLRGG